MLFAAARETDKRAARAGGDAFLWLLKAAVAHGSPQVHDCDVRSLPLMLCLLSAQLHKSMASAVPTKRQGRRFALQQYLDEGGGVTVMPNA